MMNCKVAIGRIHYENEFEAASAKALNYISENGHRLVDVKFSIGPQFFSCLYIYEEATEEVAATKKSRRRGKVEESAATAQ